MKSIFPLILLALATVAPAWADVFDPLAPTDATAPIQHSTKAEGFPESPFLKELKEGVQITELGTMRATFVFAKGSEDTEKQVLQSFSDKDFRVFPSGQVIEGVLDPKKYHEISAERFADLVVYTESTSREVSKLGNMVLYECEATLRVYSPMSGEILVTDTKRAKGKRHTDPVVAQRSAREAAVAAAANEVATKTLEKAHKILVHEVQLKGVQDDTHLREILEYTAHLKGVYHVRQMTYDKAAKLAVIEITAAPATETEWRAYLDRLPKHEFITTGGRTVRIDQNTSLREKHPDWFTK